MIAGIEAVVDIETLYTIDGLSGMSLRGEDYEETAIRLRNEGWTMQAELYEAMAKRWHELEG